VGNKIQNLCSDVKEAAANDCFKRRMKRKNRTLSLRHPKTIFIARAAGFSRELVGIFFDWNEEALHLQVKINTTFRYSQCI